MKEHKLISMLDFVTQHLETGCAVEQIQKLRRYANFLKQPLKLEMFVPVDEEGNVLVESNHIFGWEDKRCNVPMYTQDYLEAKEKVLFEGFEIRMSRIPGDEGNKQLCKDGGQVWADVDTEMYGKFHVRYPSFAKSVEDMAGLDLALTPSAVKIIGL